MAELLSISLTDPTTGRSITPTPTSTPTVRWGSVIDVAVYPPPTPPQLHCWGIGPNCGGLATSQPVHIGGGFYYWVIGTTPDDVMACHAANISECWLTDPTQYSHNPDRPDNFGNWATISTPRSLIDEVIPPAARLACVLSTPPPITIPPTSTPPPDLMGIYLHDHPGATFTPTTPTPS